MGNHQPKTPVATDNTTAQGIINRTMIPKRVKSYNMRFNFLKRIEAQNQFVWIWRRGRLNRKDYHRKRHPIKKYTDKRGEYIADMPLPSQ